MPSGGKRLTNFSQRRKPCADYLLDQSSHERVLIRPNSLALPVMSVILWRSACPAIRRSYSPIGLPMDSNSARSPPAKRASSPSKGSRLTGPERKDARIRELKSRRLLLETPYQSSKTLTDETCAIEPSPICESKRARTEAGLSFISAMQTFVSSRHLNQNTYEWVAFS